MSGEKTVALTVNTRYKQGYTGVLVGQCIEVPFIIVEGKSVQELTNNVFYEFQVYFNTFPEEGKKILEKYGRIVQTEEEKQEINKDTEEGWTGMKIKVPIPTLR
ncbi:MAG: hypothetical protein WA667_18610 [Candidatus Nitrosopolaris sp.]